MNQTYSAEAAVNARTCIHATPEPDGTWSCAKCGTVPLDQQAQPCPHHLYISMLVKFARAIDADPERNRVWYEMEDGRKFWNTDHPSAPGEYTSEELSVMDSALIGNADYDAARLAFGARH